MAKRQNFVVGSINPNTKTWTSSELNNGWDKYQVLYSGDLDGVFNAVSDYSNDSSQEIANAIQALTGAQPTGASQNELAGALQQMREDIETSSLTFKGYVATSAPSSSTYGLVEGNMWINASEMPTTFPVAIAGVWNGTSWDTTTETYTAKDFDFFRNINDNEGYYWFGGQWTVMSTDMSTAYFTLNQTSGKWEIKSSVNLPGAPTTTTAATTDDSTKIATTAFVKNVLEGYVPTGGAANTSLSNLVDAGKNISNWSSNVTNCITEIPQDIKLELNNGTLTLKAGSKVYVPNGAGVFDEVTISSDVSATWGYNDKRTLCYRNGVIGGYSTDDTFSGSSAPSGSTYMTWYDTTNNVVKQTANGGSTWDSGWSLPICIVTTGSGVFTSIDQVFNGFGYIGSTVFALPGVKGLIPNGRNADGTLKNTIVTLSSVVTMAMANYMAGRQHCPLNILGDGSIGGTDTGQNNWGTVSKLSDIKRVAYSCWYCEEDNFVHYFNGSVVENLATRIFVGSFDVDSNNKITSLTTKTAFHAVDYSDFADLSNEVAETDNKILQILKVIYPVGSIYIGTQNTCPMGALFGTWTKVGTSIVTSVNSTAGVKGTGKALGLTNGNKTGGLIQGQTGSTDWVLQVSPSSYNANVSTSFPWDVGSGGQGTYGVTTDASKSGLTANITSSSLTVNIWKRTA